MKLHLALVGLVSLFAFVTGEIKYFWRVARVISKLTDWEITVDSRCVLLAAPEGRRPMVHTYVNWDKHQRDAGISDDQKEIMIKNHVECLEDSKVDLALVDKVRQGDFSSDDVKLQRYVFCISLKNDLITSEGELKMDVIASKISNDPEKVKAAIVACMQKLGTNPLESVWKIAKCYYGNLTLSDISDHP